MYDRRYGDKVLTFEASGGLINSSLVLQDRETDSYWAIMRGKSLNGELAGTPMKEIAVNQKMTWKDWRAQHPDTLVLSVDGVEDQVNAYDNYFQSEQGFRNNKASDTRLDTKTPIFAFRLKESSYAVRYSDIVGGREFQLGTQTVYLHRNDGAGLLDSTRAYVADSISGCTLDSLLLKTNDTACARPLSGFDTFWYNWSLNNPDTELLQ